MPLNNVPPIRIGNLELSLFQGGMGVGISGKDLAAAVTEEGGLGVIASVALGVLKDYPREYLDNAAALRDEIKEARRMTNGPIGVNIMHALSDYPELVKAAVDEGVDAIISGAGVPKDLPTYLNGKNIKLIPIVSSARLANILCKAWGRYGHLPDAIVVEGPKAGGHLGYTREELDQPGFIASGLERIVPEVVQAVKPYEIEGRKIPVIAAGGIFYGGDIAKFIALGAAGAQMATRLVTTNECDANPGFKEAYLQCNSGDIGIIDSPIGMPGRAIINQFLHDVAAGKMQPTACPYKCLKPCDSNNVPYCIAEALLNAQQGNFQDGFAFVGSNAHLCKEIIPVKKLLEKLDEEYRIGKRSD